MVNIVRRLYIFELVDPLRLIHPTFRFRCIERSKATTQARTFTRARKQIGIGALLLAMTAIR